MNFDINNKYKVLIVPQSGFYVNGDCLLTVKNRAIFYTELAKKFKFSTILYTTAMYRSPDDTHRISDNSLNFVCLKDNKNKNFLRTLTNYFISIIKLFRLLNSHDIAVVCIPNKSGSLTAFLGYILRKIVIVYVTGDWQQISLITYKTKKKSNLFMRYLKYCLNTVLEAVTTFSATFVFVAGRELLYKLARFNKCIEESIPMIEFDKKDMFFREDTFKSKTLSLLYVGYLTELKGIKYLVEAFEKIKIYYPDSVLNIVGDGELYDDFKHYSNNQIIFHGHINNKNKLSYLYKTADVFICPSLSEGFPRVIYEAMIHSVPIITTSVGGIKFFCKDETDVLLVQPKSAEQIFNKFCLLANDEFLRQKLILNSQKKLKYIFRCRTSEQFYQKIIECTANRINNSLLLKPKHN